MSHSLPLTPSLCQDSPQGQSKPHPAPPSGEQNRSQDDKGQGTGAQRESGPSESENPAEIMRRERPTWKGRFQHHGPDPWDSQSPATVRDITTHRLHGAEKEMGLQKPMRQSTEGPSNFQGGSEDPILTPHALQSSLGACWPNPTVNKSARSPLAGIPHLGQLARAQNGAEKGRGRV